MTTLYTFDEWNEDIGAVLWWKFPIDEAPYVGTPLDTGFPVTVCTCSRHGLQFTTTAYFGGWPGYHTHWTPLEIPASPTRG